MTRERIVRDISVLLNAIPTRIYVARESARQTSLAEAPGDLVPSAPIIYNAEIPSASCRIGNCLDLDTYDGSALGREMGD